MKELKTIFFILLNVSTLVSWAQINCTISVADSVEICEGESIQLLTSGTIYEFNWSKKSGLNDSTIPNPIASPASTTKYYVTNRYLFPTESIINGDFENGNTDFTSQYVQKCINGRMDWGAYCISKVSNIFWTGWGDCSDHTNGLGNMMVMDAAVAAGVGIWCETVPINQNTDYQFTTWVTSMVSLNPALLQFSINNKVLDQPFRAASEVCKWKEFYALWNSGSATSAEICVINQNTEDQGNDFALDDISFKSICVSTDSIVVQVHPQVSVELGGDKIVCEGDSILIDTKLPSNYIYNWSTPSGPNAKSIWVTKTGTYSVDVDNGLGCTDNDAITLTPIENPINTLEKDTTICFAFLPEFELHGGSALKYIWSTGDTSATISVADSGQYILTLYNGKNCSIIDTVNIENYCNPTFFYIPNSFSPNGDGINDVFTVKGEYLYIFKLSIFSRWGELLFETTNPEKEWDGNGPKGAAPTDIYVVLYEYEGLSPNTLHRIKERKHTHLSLIR